jgi:hypothetical protein
MQQSRYRPILPDPAKRYTSASQDESFDFAEEARRPILTQLGYHYMPTPRNGDESMSMPSPPMGLTQVICHTAFLNSHHDATRI